MNSASQTCCHCLLCVLTIWIAMSQRKFSCPHFLRSKSILHDVKNKSLFSLNFTVTWLSFDDLLVLKLQQVWAQSIAWFRNYRNISQIVFTFVSQQRTYVVSFPQPMKCVPWQFLNESTSWSKYPDITTHVSHIFQLRHLCFAEIEVWKLLCPPIYVVTFFYVVTGFWQT